MKARVKATGDIVEVEFVERNTHTGEQVYMTHEGCLIEESRLDFNVEPIDYWTRLEHQAAIAAMQGMLTNPKLCEIETPISLASTASTIANALVEKYKKEERK